MSYSVEIEGLVSLKHKLMAENERLRAALNRLQSAYNNKEISGLLWDADRQCYVSLPIFFGRVFEQRSATIAHRPSIRDELDPKRERSSCPCGQNWDRCCKPNC